MEALGINVPGLIAQIVNFGLLLVLLSLVLYKPVLRMLDQRAARIRESLQQAEAVKQDMAKAEQQVQAHLDEARQEGQVLIGQAAQLGERLKEEARQEARHEADAIISRARSEIQMERDEAIAELRRQFADLTILAAGKVINRSLDKQAHKELIDEVLESVSLNDK